MPVQSLRNVEIFHWHCGNFVLLVALEQNSENHRSQLKWSSRVYPIGSPSNSCQDISHWTTNVKLMVALDEKSRDLFPEDRRCRSRADVALPVWTTYLVNMGAERKRVALQGASRRFHLLCVPGITEETILNNFFIFLLSTWQTFGYLHLATNCYCSCHVKWKWRQWVGYVIHYWLVKVK